MVPMSQRLWHWERMRFLSELPHWWRWETTIRNWKRNIGNSVRLPELMTTGTKGRILPEFPLKIQSYPNGLIQFWQVGDWRIISRL